MSPASGHPSAPATEGAVTFRQVYLRRDPRLEPWSRMLQARLALEAATREPRELLGDEKDQRALDVLSAAATGAILGSSPGRPMAALRCFNLARQEHGPVRECLRRAVVWWLATELASPPAGGQRALGFAALAGCRDPERPGFVWGGNASAEIFDLFREALELVDPGPLRDAALRTLLACDLLRAKGEVVDEEDQHEGSKAVEPEVPAWGWSASQPSYKVDHKGELRAAGPRDPTADKRLLQTFLVPCAWEQPLEGAAPAKVWLARHNDDAYLRLQGVAQAAGRHYSLQGPGGRDFPLTAMSPDEVWASFPLASLQDGPWFKVGAFADVRAAFVGRGGWKVGPAPVRPQLPEPEQGDQHWGEAYQQLLLGRWQEFFDRVEQGAAPPSSALALNLSYYLVLLLDPSQPTKAMRDGRKRLAESQATLRVLGDLAWLAPEVRERCRQLLESAAP